MLRDTQLDGRLSSQIRGGVTDFSPTGYKHAIRLSLCLLPLTRLRFDVSENKLIDMSWLYPL